MWNITKIIKSAKTYLLHDVALERLSEGAKYYHGVWEQFADIVLKFQLILYVLIVQRIPSLLAWGNFLHVQAKMLLTNLTALGFRWGGRGGGACFVGETLQTHVQGVWEGGPCFHVHS